MIYHTIYNIYYMYMNNMIYIYISIKLHNYSYTSRVTDLISFTSYLELIILMIIIIKSSSSSSSYHHEDSITVNFPSFISLRLSVPLFLAYFSFLGHLNKIYQDFIGSTDVPFCYSLPGVEDGFYN